MLNFRFSMTRFLSGFFILSFVLISCSQDEPGNSVTCSGSTSFDGDRNFRMGFTSWSHGPEVADIEDTYAFLATNSDIYSEQIDNIIPWKALINGTELPEEFINNIAFRVSKKPQNAKLLLSVSLLNIDRTDLNPDVDGTLPEYTSFSDQAIENAYFDFLIYLIDQFQPEYLVMAMEVNELLAKSEPKWEGYKLLMQNLRNRIRTAHPALKISESITLHNWLNPNVTNPETFIEEIDNYITQMDFAAISFYPFLKGKHNKTQFQQAFDFLHSKVDIPVAFVETSHLAEDLSVQAFDLFIPGDECEQKEYLETLLQNASQQEYEFIIWWAHRDFDRLWETFPEEVKDLGKLWRDTGLLNEDGEIRPAYSYWKSAFDK